MSGPEAPGTHLNAALAASTAIRVVLTLFSGRHKIPSQGRGRLRGEVDRHRRPEVIAVPEPNFDRACRQCLADSWLLGGCACSRKGFVHPSRTSAMKAFRMIYLPIMSVM